MTRLVVIPLKDGGEVTELAVTRWGGMTALVGIRGEGEEG
jgi:hypothetical protein